MDIGVPARKAPIHHSPPPPPPAPLFPRRLSFDHIELHEACAHKMYYDISIS